MIIIYLAANSSDAYLLALHTRTLFIQPCCMSCGNRLQILGVHARVVFIVYSNLGQKLWVSIYGVHFITYLQLDQVVVLHLILAEKTPHRADFNLVGMLALHSNFSFVATSHVILCFCFLFYFGQLPSLGVVPCTHTPAQNIH